MKTEKLLIVLLIALSGCSQLKPSFFQDGERAPESCSDVIECTNDIKTAVRYNWSKPDSVTRDLSIYLDIKLDNKGNLVYLTIHKASGNEEFDQSVIESVKKSAPFTRLENLSPEIFNKVFSHFVLMFDLDYLENKNQIQPILKNTQIGS